MEGPSRSPFTAHSPDAPRVVRPVSREATPINAAAGPSISVGDVYYTLFRHKGKILGCAFAGILAAFVFSTLKPAFAESRAKLFIRYITDTKAVVTEGDEKQTKFTDQGGDTIINSELEILTSFDLAQQAAATIGPERILDKPGTGDRLFAAAIVIKKGLNVEVPPQTSVISISFRHPDPAIVQQVLREIIGLYLKKHSEVHQSSGIADSFLTKETENLRSRLADTEEELRKAKNKAGVISIDDSKKAYTEQISKIRQEILSAEAELAERSSVFQELTKSSPDRPATETHAEPTPEQVNQYRALVSRQDGLQKREQDLLSYFREDNSRVKEVRAQLAEVEQQKKKITDEFPQMVRSAPPAVITPGQPAAAFDPAAESARLTALQAKIKVLVVQLDAIGAEASKIDQMEGTISELRRKKELDEANYKYYSASLEHARIADALGSGSVSNISQIQTPSPAYIDRSKTYKIMAGIAAGGVAIGIGWAFLIELFLDRSVRRPGDFERMLRMPLFLSIPKLSRKELSQGTTSSSLQLPAPAGSKELAVKERSGTEVAPWDSDHALHPFHETLRDRLINYFESVNLTHKPKLVAVTGIGHSGGVTTTAAGLASTLSETGDGNVLLVDMTQGQGSAQQFYQGKAVCGLEEILDARDSGQIDQNLYVVGQEPGGEKLSRILPHRFNKLVPKLKASNFDYIIFDMPPVSQISITPRLAGFMDMVLLVIESEKTDRDLVQRATALLAQSKVHVGAVLNKTKTYVPPQLHQESLGDI